MELGAPRYPARMLGKPSDMAVRPSFEVGKAELNGAPGVAVRGEIDAAAVPALELAIDAAVYGSVGAFVLDLSDVTFLDSSGLRLLLHTRALLGRKDRALAVVCHEGGAVRRVLELAGIADLLFLFASREEAAGVLVPPAERPG